MYSYQKTKIYLDVILSILIIVDPQKFQAKNGVFFWDEFMTTSFFRFTGFHSNLDLRHFGLKIALRRLDLICLPFFLWSVN